MSCVHQLNKGKNPVTWSPSIYKIFIQKTIIFHDFLELIHVFMLPFPVVSKIYVQKYENEQVLK